MTDTDDSSVPSQALSVARAIASGDMSAPDAVDAALQRIARANPTLHAFSWVREQARKDAVEAQHRVEAGRGRQLEGVPFTVKDVAALVDGPTTSGSRAFRGRTLGVDAHVVARLRQAGAILVATTTTPELCARPTTESDQYGVTRNPWDTSRTCGGSSGGAAVSAALEVAALNMGSDAAGSLRLPAACCGVVGLKPQRGRVSLGPIQHEEWVGLNVYGVISRTVADAALFLDITAGPAAGDMYWAPPPSQSFLAAGNADPGRLRVAVAFERDGIAVDPQAKDATRDTADLLASLGHDVTEQVVSFDALEQSFLHSSQLGIASEPVTPHEFSLLEPRNQSIFAAARKVEALDHLHMRQAMYQLCQPALRLWDDVDVLLTPTLGWPAPLIGELDLKIGGEWADWRRWMCWTWPFNVTGQPAVSIPAGFTAGGVPLGVQLVGRPAGEATILGLARQLEQCRPWGHLRPVL